MRYEKAILGGTFDHFHLGHQAVLLRVFSISKHVYIGISSDDFVGQTKNLATKFPLSLEKYAVRQNSVVGFLRQKGFLQRSTIVKIEDRYDISITESSYQAIMVSPETKSVANEINQKRKVRGLSELNIELVPWVLADDGRPINSYRIRSGEIDRQGKLFEFPRDWKVRILPDTLRQELKKPLGELFAEISANYQSGVLEFVQKYVRAGFCVIGGKKFQPKIIAVGDAISRELLNIDVIPDISIVDLKIKRIPVYKNITEIGFRDIKVHKFAKNPAGTINLSACKTLSQLIKYEANPAVLQIVGEDDLMALAACYLSPLNYLVVYGQPDAGVVAILVSEEIKQKARAMLNKFEKLEKN